MSSFHGKHYYSLDPKGRIVIPAPLREVIFSLYNNSKLYITNAAFDKCLQLFPAEEWGKLQEKVRSLPKSDEAVKYFMRRVIASATECEMDKQGRILVPYELRSDAGIASDIVIVGLLDKIELWDKASWDAISVPDKVDTKALSAALAGYGI
ncbi:MAG TPA: division/cell wall cluster transcriptional repressor MraZ [Dissulfurispiraceae bacterium]|nr:division/cell wall cluster transcriptional repressor MraZ [Dissulfurispiraceae bacterium]